MKTELLNSEPSLEDVEKLLEKFFGEEYNTKKIEGYITKSLNTCLDLILDKQVSKAKSSNITEQDLESLYISGIEKYNADLPDEALVFFPFWL